jgi:hypothetical protein
MAEARPAIVSFLGDLSCYLRCHLGRVLLPVVRSNRVGYQRAL